MRLIFYGPLGSGSMVLDDDAPDEEIVRAMKIAATVEQGNGSNRSIKKGDSNGDNVKQ